MNTLTVTGISDELHRKLAERAAANRRSIEEEVLCCVRISIEQDEALLHSIPDERWKEIERSLGEALRETPTEFTEADKQKYRDLARGYLKA
jgi:plasmid stability protein